MTHSNEFENQAVEKFFSDTSQDYAELFLAKQRGKNFEFRQRLDIANEMAQGSAGSLMDCAAGPGEITTSILKTGRFKEATLVDLSSQMLSLAKYRIEAAVGELPPASLEFVNEDIFRFAKANARPRFDLILCLGLIAHTGRLTELLQALKQMLNRDGAILLQATLSDNLGVRLLRALTAKRHMRLHGYRISSFWHRDIMHAAQAVGLIVVAQRRYGLGVPFGDRIWAKGNYFLEKSFQGWARSVGAEGIYLLKSGD